ncbi:MAG: LytR C-terminal domain-containing protein [bacterium]|nr:LytR C-terminal domain-containing protein [bacterium]
MEETQQTFSRQESLQKTSGGGGKFIWLLIVVVILALVGGGLFFLRSRQAGEEVPTLTPTPTVTSSPTPTPTPTSEVTPTPEPKTTPTPTKKPTPTPVPQKVATTAAELKRQAISVQILNGSGAAGTAQKAADYLSGFSYTIGATGNAASYDFEKTVIEAKTETTLDLLKTDLSAQYEIGTASATLSSSSPYDAVVTIGKK